jgi:hypothetical protein
VKRFKPGDAVKHVAWWEKDDDGVRVPSPLQEEIYEEVGVVREFTVERSNYDYRVVFDNRIHPYGIPMLDEELEAAKPAADIESFL